MRIAAILACHNRKILTLASLKALYEQALDADASIKAYLLDDGSTDGTAEAVHAAFPQTVILRGDGSYFWNEGMRTAFGAAMDAGADFYLWLNDDTRLYPNALRTLLSTHDQLTAGGKKDALVVGSVQDPESGNLTYGGMVRTGRWHPFHFELLTPGDTAKQCDVMHGNCVLIPDSAARKIGNMDAGYSHAIGDIDYSLKASQNGIPVWIAPGFVGSCSTNPIKGSWLDTTLPLKQRWKQMSGPKGLPPSDWMLFAKKHAGFLWPLYGSLPYIRLVLSALKARLMPRTLEPIE